MRWFSNSLSIAMLVLVSASPAHAQLTSPQISWEAELSTLFHDVSGTVSVLDPNTLLFDDFSYDGEAPAVYFYLGTEDSQSAFTAGLSIGMLLSGNVFDGTQAPFEVDLPIGQTIEGWNAISVWCVTFSANFGSGTFLADDPSGDFNGDGDVDGDDFLLWQRDPGDRSLADWEANFGIVAPLSATSTAVPEPATWIMLLIGMTVMKLTGGRTLVSKLNSA